MLYFSDHRELLNSKKIHTITNHPVHLIGEDGALSSPSAFIPFCWFGVNISDVGRKNSQFHAPICSSFKAKVYDDKVCYEVDPNRLKKEVSFQDFNKGLQFYVDINEDRQYPTRTRHSDFMIFLDTVGRLFKSVSMPFCMVLRIYSSSNNALWSGDLRNDCSEGHQSYRRLYRFK